MASAASNNPYLKRTVAQGWNEGYNMEFNPYLHGRQRRVLDLVRELKLAPDSSCLEFGCGGGQTALELEKLGLLVQGVDVSEEFINLAREAQPAHSRAEFRVHDLNNALPFPDNTFELVVGVGVLQYLPDPHACLRHLVRVMKPDGSLIVCHRNALSHQILRRRPRDFFLSALSDEGFEFAGRHPQGILKRMVKMSNLTRWLERAGLVVTSRGQFTPPFSPRLKWWDKMAESHEFLRKYSPMIIVGAKKPV